MKRLPAPSLSSGIDRLVPRIPRLDHKRIRGHGAKLVPQAHPTAPGKHAAVVIQSSGRDCCEQRRGRIGAHEKTPERGFPAAHDGVCTSCGTRTRRTTCRCFPTRRPIVCLLSHLTFSTLPTNPFQLFLLSPMPPSLSGVTHPSIKSSAHFSGVAWMGHGSRWTPRGEPLTADLIEDFGG